MNAARQCLRWLVLAAATLLAACATSGGGDGSVPAEDKPAASVGNSDDRNDPIEGFNRAMYSFNDTVDIYVLKPVAQAYRAALPSPVRTGVSNFFGNLRDPVVMLNNLLQGKVVNAISDLFRFIVNTTVGIASAWRIANSALRCSISSIMNVGGTRPTSLRKPPISISP